MHDGAALASRVKLPGLPFVHNLAVGHYSLHFSVRNPFPAAVGFDYIAHTIDEQLTVDIFQARAGVSFFLTARLFNRNGHA